MLHKEADIPGEFFGKFIKLVPKRAIPASSQGKIWQVYGVSATLGRNHFANTVGRGDGAAANIFSRASANVFGQR